MTPDELEAILESHAKWLRGEDGGSRADLRRADLRWTDLQEADLQWADLRRADLRWADLRWADLQEADLQEADLREADLQEADLREAIVEFACWPLWCGSFGVVADKKLAAQLAYHFCRIEFRDCPEAVEAQRAMRNLANQFHRAVECGEIKEARA